MTSCNNYGTYAILIIIHKHYPGNNLLPLSNFCILIIEINWNKQTEKSPLIWSAKNQAWEIYLFPGKLDKISLQYSRFPYIFLYFFLKLTKFPSKSHQVSREGASLLPGFNSAVLKISKYKRKKVPS